MIGLFPATMQLDPPDTDTWPVVMIAVITICLCVLVHYLILWDMITRLNRRKLHALVAICGTVLGLILAHLIEIGIFGLGHFILVELWGEDVGVLLGQDGATGPQDWFYYSAMVYTTVGFGDIIPTGPLRIFAACEALSGLVLITWSASFTFLVMQARWKERMGSLHMSPP